MTKPARQDFGSRIDDAQAFLAVQTFLRRFRWSALLLLLAGWTLINADAALHSVPARLVLWGVMSLWASLVCYSAVRWWASLHVRRPIGQVLLSTLGACLYALALVPLLPLRVQPDPLAYLSVVLWPALLLVLFLIGLIARENLPAGSPAWVAGYPRLLPLGVGAVVMGVTMVGGLLVVQPLQNPLRVMLPDSVQESAKLAWRTAPLWATGILVWVVGSLILDERRLESRIAGGRCLVCGYARAGIDADAACPECGHEQ